MGCGAVFGIVPFVSKRSTGTVTGIVAAGGSLGSAITQVRAPTAATYLSDMLQCGMCGEAV
jgi:NNP family nitrate/nitrite transporter-like MFS transporter